MSKSPDIDLINYHIGLLTQEISDVSPLLRKLKLQEPDQIELRALGAVFQSVYSGIEVILQQLVEVPEFQAHNWHKVLLSEALRTQILSEDQFSRFDQFRGFRHKFRHAYGVTLKWEMMGSLYKLLMPVIDDIQEIARRYQP